VIAGGEIQGSKFKVQSCRWQESATEVRDNLRILEKVSIIAKVA
jgi:hypothetical protein